MVGVNVSRDLLWIATKDFNAHMFKRKGIRKVFSTDPLNPRGFQTFANAGALQPKALNVLPHPSGRGVQLVYKKKTVVTKPSKSLVKVPLTHSAGKTIKTIKNFCNKTRYRRDLKTVALRRASAILRSQRARKVTASGKGATGKGAKKD